jgi:glucan phosphoethanolaminetransferase (alkaline phosphatase superfamily)
METSNQKLQPTRSIQFTLFVALVFTLVFYGLTIFPFDGSLPQVKLAALRLAMGLSNATLILLCLANSRWLLVLGTPTLIVASAMAAYFRLQMGIVVDANVIGALFEADRNETHAFLTNDVWGLLFLSSLVGLGVSVFYIRNCWRALPLKRGLLHFYFLFSLTVLVLFSARWIGEFDPTWLAICVASLTGAWAIIRSMELSRRSSVLASIAYAVLLAPAMTASTESATYLPTNLAKASVSFLADQVYVARTHLERTDISEPLNAIVDHSSANLVIVLVIGESARADHFSINGYARQTSPGLQAATGLVSFTNARSCSAATRVSVPCLLTRATEKDLTATSGETSLISVFRRFNFDTAWISTNQIYGRHDTPITAIAKEAGTRVFRTNIEDLRSETLDGALIEPFKDFLKKPESRKFIVLHQRGSHWHYHERYPVSFRKFTPTCEGDTPPYACAQERLINGYDNSVLYTDHILTEVIHELSERNALLLFTSDHGQSLGEDGFYTHGSPERPEQRHIPMVWWASKIFQQQHPEILPALASRRDLQVSHDHVFHSLLGCSGLHGKLLDEKLNLCSYK